MDFIARHRRRVLCVFPRYAPSFGTFSRAYGIMGVKAFMPPLGILTLMAYLPKGWDVRFIDENMGDARDADFAWAEIVMVSGMHVQRPEIDDILDRAKQAGCTTVLGGSSASAAPEWYPNVDYLHQGEMGDATDRLIEMLDADPTPPPRQIALVTEERLPLDQFPAPAWDKAALNLYFIGALQYSSGCPYRCEFCDIPGLYGRVPRLKQPEQVIEELEGMLARGVPGAIYFVDDNFVGNRKAARDLLPHLVAWQKKHGYPISFACEATLNIARDDEILALMREAYFATVFCGIETPEPDALNAMDKKHNLSMPILAAIDKLNSYGIEVVSGVIMGLDTDTPGTPEHILEFVRASNIPMLTVNLLQALPKTPLWERLDREGRLIDDRVVASSGLESNVVFKQPYEEVLEGWRYCVREIYKPEALWERLAYNAERTYGHRIKPPASNSYMGWREILHGLGIVARLLIRAGLLAKWRGHFWKHAVPRLRKGQIREAMHMAMLAHHLIGYAEDALEGSAEASFYAPSAKMPVPLAAE